MKYKVRISRVDKDGCARLRVYDLQHNIVMSTWDLLSKLELEAKYWLSL